MQLHVRTRIPASPDAVVHFLSSQAYLDEVAARTASLERGDVIEHVVEDEGRKIVSSVRWIAPTRLPRFLQRYEDRAPATVSWVETTRWNMRDGTAELTVTPDVPDAWRSRYDSTGTLSLTRLDGESELVQNVEFRLHVPVLGKAIERLVKSEVEQLLELRLGIMREHFDK